MLSDFFDITRWAAVLVLVFLVGCSILDNHQASAKLAIQYATLKYVDGDQAKGDRVLAVVANARELSATATTLDALHEAVRQSISWDKLDDADKLLASNLLDMIRDELQARFDSDLLEPEQVVAVHRVLDWVEEAAQL
jgi:hypothetical protein